MDTFTEAPPVPPKVGKRKKREPLLVNAKRFARALDGYRALYGMTPMIKEIAPALGYSLDKPVGLSRVIRKMVDQGWLKHRANHQRDLTLTDLGRKVLLGNGHEDHDVPETEQEDVRPTPPTPTYARPPQNNLAEQRGTWSPMMKVMTPKPEPEPEPEPEPLPDPEVAPEPDRSNWPEPGPVTPQPINVVEWLTGIDTVDLVLELQDRGFKIVRR